MSGSCTSCGGKAPRGTTCATYGNADDEPLKGHRGLHDDPQASAGHRRQIPQTVDQIAEALLRPQEDGLARQGVPSQRGVVCRADRTRNSGRAQRHSYSFHPSSNSPCVEQRVGEIPVRIHEGGIESKRRAILDNGFADPSPAGRGRVRHCSLQASPVRQGPGHAHSMRALRPAATDHTTPGPCCTQRRRMPGSMRIACPKASTAPRRSPVSCRRLPRLFQPSACAG